MTSEKPGFEFFGPYLGPVGIVFGLPLVCYVLAFLVCSTDPVELKLIWDSSEFISLFGFMIVLGYVGTITGLHIILPAKHVDGTLLENKTRLKYRLNGKLHMLWSSDFRM